MGVILALNIGSSSQKCAVYNDLKLIWKASSNKGLQSLFDEILMQKFAITSVGHRVVHGGNNFIEPIKLTASIESELISLAEISPLHNKANVEGIEMAIKCFPNAMQYAVFDTAFHATLPEVAYTYPLPVAWRDLGIRRFGFHGISFKYCSSRVKNSGKMIICHLGSGASLCALQNGVSIATTMGFTPLEGLMMATRSGTIDPGIHFFLASKNIQLQEMEDGLYHSSGLLGVSELSADMKEVIEDMDLGNSKANLAYNLYLYHLKMSIAALVGALNGLDTLVFTAGIGENSARLRRDVCESLSFLGLHLSSQNEAQSIEDHEISSPSSKVRILVIPTNEEFQIASEFRLL